MTHMLLKVCSFWSFRKGINFQKIMAHSSLCHAHDKIFWWQNSCIKVLRKISDLNPILKLVLVLIRSWVVIVFALITYAQHLRPYFQVHPIVVLID